MEWYENLYAGKSVANGVDKIKRKIRRGVVTPGVYVITLASNPKNLLDLIPSSDLRYHAYPKRSIVVVGLAGGYGEAVHVAASIIEDVYWQTGGFDIRAFLDAKMGRKGNG